MASVDGGWAPLLASIGAQPSAWRFSGLERAGPPEWQVTLAQVGIEVGLDDIEIDQSTGLYLFKGQQVLIYIKFTHRSRDVLVEDKNLSPRFHFRDCKTIQEMKARNRFQRYVAIARTDGYFPVVSQEEQDVRYELEAELGPCKWCLRETGYKSYPQLSHAKQREVWDNFSIEEFFAIFSALLSSIPIDSCLAVDPGKYAKDWAQKSEEVRRKAGWRCSACRVELRTHRRLLHAHHVDGDKGNNWLHNLRALCVLCHRDQPGHGRMHVRFVDEVLLKKLRKDQGLT